MLSSLAELPRGATVSELAATLDLNRTVVYRLVSTLEQHDLARRDQTGRVHLGLGVLVLARSVQPMLRHLAVPALRTLAEGALHPAWWFDLLTTEPLVFASLNRLRAPSPSWWERCSTRPRP